ncbi:MAG: UDP-N-acetylglucosamine 2-epimerase (non-hydrolyzing) [Acidobacteriota bacterium]|nr:UDP-N-acetylglucosamine 2-epimerase (non-hydrolyzing) [Acidobacteriota bacterium]
MNKLKVMTVVGTRPEIIRLSRVIAKLDQYTEHVLVHTGQNYDYELNEIFFEDLEIRKPDYYLEAAGKTPAETVGMVIARSYDVMNKEKPDAILILGDTNSCLAAYSAKRLKIPVFHMEAGNRCFDERVPEEINRRLVDHIADINLPYSQISREYLLMEGIPADRIIKTGSPMYEVLHYYMPKIKSSNILERLNLKENDYYLVSCHREENVDDPEKFKKLIDVLNGLTDEFKKRIIFSTHPRTRKRIEAERVSLSPLVEIHKPFSFSDYVRLELGAIAVLSDSGTITEESSILNFPALNIRESHERPEGMEEGAVMMVGFDLEKIIQALNVTRNQPKGDSRILKMINDYDAPNVSEKVLRIIISYIAYIKRNVWKKS